MWKIIIVGTGEVALGVIQKCIEHEKIELLGVVLDEAVSKEYQEEFSHKLCEWNVKILQMEEHSFAAADAIFACEYRRIIPEKYVNTYHFINCHGGVLPYYRGFAANAWAIMNGEKEIGYSIHRMNEKLDDGDIYHVEHIPISEKQTYADVHNIMTQHIIDNTADLLADICSGKCKPYKQKGPRVYCNRFQPSMGNIGDFDVDAEYIYNLYRCMAEPLGTGIYFWYKGRKYHIGAVELGKNRNVPDYIGIPGKIVNIEKDELWIKTKDNVIIFSSITDEEGEKIGVNKFMNGNRLGSTEKQS